MIKMKDGKIGVFIAGFLSGSFLTVMFLGTAYLFYKLGQRSGNLSPEYVIHKAKEKLAMPQDLQKGGAVGINLSFEEGELEWFSPQGITVEKSKEYVTDGSYSLKCSFPAGGEYPGLEWEVYKLRDCIDSRHASTLSLDVYNKTTDNVPLFVKLKSGANYPKKKYETVVTLAPQTTTPISISMEDLKGSLDISQISYIKFFLSEPHGQAVLYFDHLRIK